LASGSASRSLYDGWVTWGKVDGIADTSDLHASPYKGPVNAMFSEMGDAILIVSSEKKALSSTLGHRLMDAHPFADARYQQARNNLGELMSVLKTNDFERFASIVEQEALTLHGLLMTSSEKGLLLQPNSVRMIQAIRQAREYQGIPVCFTIDAGPNIHLLYPLSAWYHSLKMNWFSFVKMAIGSTTVCVNQS
jgi:diphosphomevalonate decarboxylase